MERMDGNAIDKSTQAGERRDLCGTVWCVMWVGIVASRNLRTWSAGGSVEPCSQPWEGSSKTIQAPSSSGYKNTRDKIYCTGVGALQVQRQY